ncbi:head-tail connector protein [Consotaella aegiceratis]|uniref:head-tail connector protein n=1 Tax=Consotaella aegiceratis TaxID=3097961 RepID=UPI002F3E5B36
MTLDATTLRDHLNGVPDDDAALSRLLGAATAHVEAQLGFALDDADEFPDGTPADIEQAVLMVAAHWYENREATVVGVSAQELPIGVVDIIREHRNYTYG